MTTNGESAETAADAASAEQVAAIKENRPPSMAEILQAVAASEDLDACFIMSGIFNVYIDAIRRMQNRMHLGPQDIQNCLRISHVMLTPPPYDKQFAPRRRQ